MKCIIFDFDGTLANTQEGILASHEATAEKMGLPPIDRERLKECIGLPLKENMTKGMGLDDETAEKAMIVYREVFDVIGMKCTTLFPGVDEVLSTLSQRGIPMAIASSRSPHSLIALCKQLGIINYIPQERIFGAGCVENPKPAPDLVELILEEMDGNPREALVVGDTTFDIEMGRNAGCYTCAVTWGNHDADTLAASRPDFMINDIRQML